LAATRQYTRFHFLTYILRQFSAVNFFHCKKYVLMVGSECELMC